jgi:hypothetical protein
VPDPVAEDRSRGTSAEPRAARGRLRRSGRRRSPAVGSPPVGSPSAGRRRPGRRRPVRVPGRRHGRSTGEQPRFQRLAVRLQGLANEM